MTTFNHKQTYVWIWLPNAVQPVVAGKLELVDHYHDFFYGQSYLENDASIALSPKEMPLIGGQRYSSPFAIHSVFRDALPDAWGQRILLHRYATLVLSLLDMLLLSSSDRIGALHFQESASDYQPQYENNTSLQVLMDAAQHIEKNLPLPEELDLALMHGTSVGGARPKALIEQYNRKFIAKFSSSTDVFPIVQAEYAAMWHANKLGLKVAPVELLEIKGKYILLVERFDREYDNNSMWKRKFIVSALSLLELDEIEGRYASYLELADTILKVCKNPSADLQELYQRMVFNILIGNTDDHAKNHSFFWDGQSYALTPAYDICPYARAGYQATQAMIVGEFNSFSTLKNALSAAKRFQLSEQEAQHKIDRLVSMVRDYWPEACEHAKLTVRQQEQLKNSILNPYCFYDAP